jgi:hypothetical protein
MERVEFMETYRAIAYEFGGYSLFKNVEGVGGDEKGKEYRDVHHVVLILAVDTPTTQAWPASIRDGLRNASNRRKCSSKFPK